jgi:hypothetical protein
MRSEWGREHGKCKVLVSGTSVIDVLLFLNLAGGPQNLKKHISVSSLSEA